MDVPRLSFLFLLSEEEEEERGGKRGGGQISGQSVHPSPRFFCSPFVLPRRPGLRSAEEVCLPASLADSSIRAGVAGVLRDLGVAFERRQQVAQESHGHHEIRLQEVLLLVVPTSPTGFRSSCCGAENGWPPAGLQWVLCFVLFFQHKAYHL